MATSIPAVEMSSSAQEIAESIASLGFLLLKSPPTPSPGAIGQMFDISINFFQNEDLENKHKVGITTSNAGWVRNRQEALDAQKNPRGDIKEAFNLRQFDGDDNPRQPLPPTLASKSSEIATFMRSCHSLCMRLLESFAISLDLPSDFFTSKHGYDRPQGSVLRLLYYPPTDTTSTSDSEDIRAGAHSDYGSMTLLFQRDVGGLQILLPNLPGEDESAKWLDAPVVKDSVLVNIGDAFDFWTGGKFKSTQHRVTHPRNLTEAGPRYSIAYFLHPDDDVPLSRILPNDAVSEDEYAKRSIKERFGVDPDERPLSAKDWLDRRLQATYSGRSKEGDTKSY